MKTLTRILRSREGKIIVLLCEVQDVINFHSQNIPNSESSGPKLDLRY